MRLKLFGEDACINVLIYHWFVNVAMEMCTWAALGIAMVMAQVPWVI